MQSSGYNGLDIWIEWEEERYIQNSGGEIPSKTEIRWEGNIKR
jgi:hypothetical protein